MSHQLCNWMKYPLSVKSFISLFSRLTSVIKYNDVMVKYSLSDETIWLTMGISFRFIRLKNGLALCHGDATDFLSLINTIKPSTMNRLKVSSDRDIWSYSNHNLNMPYYTSYFWGPTVRHVLTSRTVASEGNSSHYLSLLRLLPYAAASGPCQILASIKARVEVHAELVLNVLFCEKFNTKYVVLWNCGLNL
jgi:hypothetical protein